MVVRTEQRTDEGLLHELVEHLSRDLPRDALHAVCNAATPQERHTAAERGLDELTFAQELWRSLFRRTVYSALVEAQQKQTDKDPFIAGSNLYGKGNPFLETAREIFQRYVK